MQGQQLEATNGQASSSEEVLGGFAQGPPGCVALVALEFCQRPEWLRPGARLILRDRCDNRMCGAGVVRALLPSSRRRAVPPEP